MTYTYITLTNDIAEVFGKSGLDKLLVSIGDEKTKHQLVTLSVSQLQAFMLGWYNMTYSESNDIIKSFAEEIDNNMEQFVADIEACLKMNSYDEEVSVQ